MAEQTPSSPDKARQRDQCRRETPVTITQTDGTLIEGVLDLAFQENGEWVVVDFKTDRELERGLEDYRRQVSLYATAVSQATQKKVIPILIRI